MKKKYLKDLFLNNNYLKQTKVIISSSIISKLITVISLPIITRIYDPDNFGVYTAFASTIGLINPISTFRYERAITIAKNQDEEIKIVITCILLSIFTSILLFFGIIIVEQFFFKFRNFIEILIAVPTGSMLIGIYQPLYYYAIKKQAFKSISRSKLIQSIGALISQLILFPTGSIGLIVGYIILNSAGFEGYYFYFLKISFRSIKKYLLNIPYIIKKYSDFGFYLFLSSIVEQIGTNLPKILILNAYGQEILGFLGLSISLYNIPIFIALNSFGTFFIGNVNNLFIKGSLKKEIKKIILNLFIFGFLLCLITNILVPNLIGIFLPYKWFPIINIIRIISPLFVCELISSTINSAFYPSRNLKLSFKYQLLLSLMMIIPLFISIKLNLSFNYTLFIYVLSSCIGYLLQIFSMTKNSIKKKIKN